MPSPDISNFWLRVAAVLYVPGMIYGVLLALRREARWFRTALTIFGIGTILHLVSLVDLARQTGRFPAETFYESISLCAFLLASLFLFVNWRYRLESLSIIVFPLVLIMTVTGSLGVSHASWPDARVRDAWLLLHVTLALAGYAALLVAVAASIFYLVQERRLKHKLLSQKLPPLATLDNVLSRSMSIGFVMITLAVLMGSVWGFMETGTRWISDPKIVVAWATWVGYLAMVFLRLTAGWRGRKAALMAISVLGFSALTWAAHIGIRTELGR